MYFDCQKKMKMLLHSENWAEKYFLKEILSFLFFHDVVERDFFLFKWDQKLIIGISKIFSFFVFTNFGVSLKMKWLIDLQLLGSKIISLKRIKSFKRNPYHSFPIRFLKYF